MRAGFARCATRFRSRVDAISFRGISFRSIPRARARRVARVACARTPTRAVECRRVTFPRVIRFDSFVIMSTLDAVFATCARTLARRASSSSASSSSASSPGVAARAAREISDALNAVRLADVSRALDAYAARARERDEMGSRARLQPCVTYLGLRAEREYSIGAFVFDASQTMPLHNHPGMTCS